VTADAAPVVLPRRWVHGDGGGPVPTRQSEPRVPPVDDPIERVRAALSDVAAGRPVLVSDENGGDLVVASELTTPELMSFLIRHTSGFVCVAVPEDDADRLDLPLMARPDRGPAQCVAVDARAGVSTGISAADRATTIRLLAAPDTVPEDLVRPGHVVPLRVWADGVLGRRGRAEAAVDLAGLAGLRPSGALCGLVSTIDPTRMAHGPELDHFAHAHGLQRITVSDLVAYRMRFEKLVERRVTTTMPLPAGPFTAVGYRSRLDGREHLALVHGVIGDGDDVPVHVHSECLAGDILGSTRCGCGERLRSALAGIADGGRGIVVYLRGGRGDLHLLAEAVPRAHQDGGDQPPVVIEDWLRDHGDAGQILRDLGVRSTRLVARDALDQRCAAPHG
jgi:3,4-dihydroxy 2-butanone 4-phosphate synthase/GTP cyclohydrolase II